MTDRAFYDLVRIVGFDIRQKFQQGSRRKGISSASSSRKKKKVENELIRSEEIYTYLLRRSHPFATKLPNKTSAWALVRFSFSLVAETSRRAARDETENDSFRASMICSTLSVFLSKQRRAKIPKMPYHGLEVRQLVRGVIRRELS